MSSVQLTCGNYRSGPFWSGTFEPGLSAEPPECGHEFTVDRDDCLDWTVCPECGGEVYVEPTTRISQAETGHPA